MDTSKTVRSLVVMFTIAFALVACGDDVSPAAVAETSTLPPSPEAVVETEEEPAVSSTESPVGREPSPAFDSLDAEFKITEGLTAISEAFERSGNIWPGFDPNTEPIVLPLKTDGVLKGAIALNHPSPAALGTLTSIDLPTAVFGSAYLVTEPADEDQLASIQTFEFHAQLGGVDSFAMVVDRSDDFFDLNGSDYSSTLVHEVFHRWQDDGFIGGLDGQDIEGYAYTPENLALAALEDRALATAIQTESVEDRMSAARALAAIRITRLAADERVRLDNSQERFEGTARYVEHRTNGLEGPGVYNANNYADELQPTPNEVGSVKDHFGFGRFYASGAGVMHLLDLLEISDAGERVNAGASPVEVLIDELRIDPSSVADLVSTARDQYDPLNRLGAAAEEASRAAADEPPVFGDAGDDAALADDGQISAEEVACLEENGVDLNGSAGISDEVFDECLS